MLRIQKRVENEVRLQGTRIQSTLIVTKQKDLGPLDDSWWNGQHLGDVPLLHQVGLRPSYFPSALIREWRWQNDCKS